MTPTKPFYIVGSKNIRPDSKSTIYVDGTASGGFREGIDHELSHWIPNRTEDRYKAGSSTEICYNFLTINKSHPYDLVINNHLDIDGLLSVFVLAYPDIALAHRDVICAAAKTGDFWAWAEGKGLNLFQELTHLFMFLNEGKTDLQLSYERCFELVLKILERDEIKSVAESILDNQFQLVESGGIKRDVLCDRLVSYFVPLSLSQGRVEEYLNVAKPNEPISDRLAFWPQVRNRLDEQRIHLVGIETEQGVHYDLWLPGYLWADTKGLWRPEGFMLPDNLWGAYLMNWPALTKAIDQINDIETGSCTWTVFPSLYLFDQTNPRGFPILMSTIGKEKGRGMSHLSIDKVNHVLRQFF